MYGLLFADMVCEHNDEILTFWVSRVNTKM